MSKLSRENIEEMLEEGVSDCAGTIEELSEFIDRIFGTSDLDELNELREEWEG